MSLALALGLLSASVGVSSASSVRVELRKIGVASVVGLRVELRGGQLDELVATAELDEEHAVLALELPDAPPEEHRAWTLSCSGAGFWCPGVMLPGNGPGERSEKLPVELDVYPSLELTGELVGLPASSEVSGVLQGWWGSDPSRESSFSEPIEIEGSRWRATVPRSRLTLRLAVGDFAPMYFWDVEPTAEQRGVRELERRVLHRGGSLSGVVWDAVEGLPAADAELRLHSARATAGRPPIAVAKANAHGFFSFSGLAADDYVIETVVTGRARDRVGPIEVDDNQEVVLDELALRAMLRAEVQVEPPLDPAEEPWRLELKASAGGERIAGITAGEVAAGLYRFQDLDPGSYVLSVRDGSGERDVLGQTLEIEDDRILDPIRLDTVALSGSVLLDGEPLASRVEISSGRLDRSVFEADDDGAFEGWLLDPRPFPLLVTVEAKDGRLVREVRFDEYSISDGELELPIDLQDRKVEVTVLNGATGEGVAGADVELVRLDSAAQPSGWRATETSDEAGKATFEGVNEGSYRASAHHPEIGSSSQASMQLAAQDVALQLVLEPGARRGGVVLGADGAPLSFMPVVFVFPETAWASEAHSDVRGAFKVLAPEQATVAAAMRWSGTDPLWAGCVPIPAEGDIMVTLPQSAPGTLVLEGSRETDAPGGAGEQGYLQFESGALVPLDTLLQWNLNSSGVFGVQEDGHRIELRNLTPGRYSWVEGKAGLSMAALCASGPTPSGHWVELRAGETQRLVP